MRAPPARPASEPLDLIRGLVVPDAAQVTREVTQGHSLETGKGRDQFRDRCVPRGPIRVDQARQRRGGEQLGDRGGSISGRRGRGKIVFDVLVAQSEAQRRLVVVEVITVQQGDGQGRQLRDLEHVEGQALDSRAPVHGGVAGAIGGCARLSGKGRGDHGAGPDHDRAGGDRRALARRRAPKASGSERRRSGLGVHAGDYGGVGRTVSAASVGPDAAGRPRTAATETHKRPTSIRCDGNCLRRRLVAALRSRSETEPFDRAMMQTLARARRRGQSP